MKTVVCDYIQKTNKVYAIIKNYKNFQLRIITSSSLRRDASSAVSAAIIY